MHQIRFDGAAVADIERDDLHREVLRTQGKLTSHFGYDAGGAPCAANCAARYGWNLVPVQRKSHQELFNAFWKDFDGL
ncbi:hypothetical protein CFB49_25665 [Burkholderia sp. AU17457]|nr:hypothetical protein CFB49_25665 [Burkholderia sp. AU17457]